MEPLRDDDMATLQEKVNDWLSVVEGEFREMPGLRLTKAQVQRLWGLDLVTCDALLDVLVSSRFLRRTADDAYMRMETGF
jgi:hypothetical protein